MDNKQQQWVRFEGVLYTAKEHAHVLSLIKNGQKVLAAHAIRRVIREQPARHRPARAGKPRRHHGRGRTPEPLLEPTETVPPAPPAPAVVKGPARRYRRSL